MSLIKSFLIIAVVFSLSKGLFAQTAPINLDDYTGPVKVACVGDSITYGAGIDDRDANSYPAQMQALLDNFFGSGKFQVGNFGHSGARVSHTQAKWYKKFPEYTASIAFAPDIAIISLGINDCSAYQWQGNAPHFIADFKSLINDYRQANPNVKIWLTTLMPVVPPYRDDYYIIVNQNRITADKLIKQIAEEENVSLIDLYTPLISEPGVYATDGLHPDKTGAAIIAEKVARSITGVFDGLKANYAFDNHMVLQRNKPVKIFGTDNVGKTITVTFNGQSKSAVTDANGKWVATLNAMAANANSQDLVITNGDSTITLTDVLVGEVWIAAGQSNMNFACSSDSNWATEGPLADNYNKIRLLDRACGAYPSGGKFTAKQLDAINVNDMFTGSWKVCSKANAAAISAVAYYFAKEIHLATDVPVGIIENSVGGTTMESYIPREGIDVPDLYLLTKNWIDCPLANDWHRGRAKDNLGLWYDGTYPGPMPHHPFEPCFLWYCEMEEIKDLAFQGFLWYQGESNATDSSNKVAWDQRQNSRLFEALIKSWRAKFNDNAMPFYYVQLPSLERNWPLFREMQLNALKNINDTGMAITIDLGGGKNVHPKVKQPVGQRLARWARAKLYGETSLVYSGPICKDAKPNGNKMLLTFDHIGNGLQAKDDKPLTGFEIAGADGKWTKATASIVNNKIILSSAQVKKPQAARYAWTWQPVCNLQNKEGLPASPFRAGDLNFPVVMPNMD
ncbi:MAG: hypothetical protein JEZ07_18535 [Phycisphaerae bacterium]|nr:hypothetical protein [Phycisphaerae bacterium]